MSISKVLLISCYELGHQPFSLASPLKFMSDEGILVDTVDMAVEDISNYYDQLQSTVLIFVSVSMHNALRKGVRVSQKIRTINDRVHLCFYGDYAGLNAEYLLSNNHADSIIYGEFEISMVKLARLILNETYDYKNPPEGISTSCFKSKPVLQRMPFLVPEREKLPDYSNYSHFRDEHGKLHLAGSTETTRGCKYECLHCPITSVYHGKFFVIPEDVVLSDIRNQVEKGVRHISFMDPDFLNGPSHSMKIVRSLNNEFPEITFDFTARISHLLKYKDYLIEIKNSGCAFVVSALELLNDGILDLLDKGHTRLDIERTTKMFQEIDLVWRPSLLPFTPWTSIDDFLDLLDFVRRNDLINNIDPVQFSLRLLIPPNSVFYKSYSQASWMSNLDASNFTYIWHHPDLNMEILWSGINDLVRESYKLDSSYYDTFIEIEKFAYELAGKDMSFSKFVTQRRPIPAGLTDSWFC
tara:strand:+ start:2957 stop:4360 length:1404 start_codon:yes stop_codon:yes gene_type:complete